MRVALLSLVILIPAAGLLWWTSADEVVDITTQTPAELMDPEQMDPADIARQQEEAMQAALATDNKSAPAGPITQRPGYVSPLEWQILKSVAREHPDSEAELTRLVQYLRFSKQLESWQSPTQGMTEQQHEQLGWQLLTAIPHHVQQQNLSAHHAHEVQTLLLEHLIDDEAERRQYLRKEATRIGVTFDIKSD